VSFAQKLEALRSGQDVAKRKKLETEKDKGIARLENGSWQLFFKEGKTKNEGRTKRSGGPESYPTTEKRKKGKTESPLIRRLHKRYLRIDSHAHCAPKRKGLEKLGQRIPPEGGGFQEGGHKT